MADLEHQLKEDRALRDSARTVFRKELAHVRRETRPGALGERIANRVGAKADAVGDSAVDFAESHGKTMIAAAVGALAAAGLWFARGPIAERFNALFGHDDEDAGDAGPDFEGEEDQDE